VRQSLPDSNDPLLLSVIEDDVFLRAFLVGRKLNVKHAFETIRGYLISRHVKHVKIYRMKPRSVRHVLESGFIGVLKNRDSLGRVIGFVRCPKLDIKTMEVEDIVRSIIFLAETLFPNPELMKHGQVGVLDYSGYTFSVMTRYSLADKIAFMNVFWNNYPMMIKGVHAVNNPRIVSYAYSLLRPFIPKKVKERLRMHGNDFASLHEYLPADILPTWLGGELSDEDAINFDLIKQIINSSSP